MTESSSLDATLSATTSGRTRAERLERGAAVGRYVVLALLGTGGMGAVYAAYDPELDRKIALKLLFGDDYGGDMTGNRAMLREAQAMAKLSHPNVVAVHDVGVFDGRVYLAMEFVEGTTLGAWRNAATRSWREVLEVFLAAGRGLAAAHDRGIVHRDFKPANVLVGADGRARVTDFGLATIGDNAEPGSVGTPAYMAPEHHRGGELGPATDQFAFCVALWEGLYGERPFAGKTVGELAAHVVEGLRRPAPRGSGVPGWLRAAVQRGLSVEAAHRWPTIAVLLDALERGRARARFWALGAGLGAIAGVAGSLLIAQSLHTRQRIAACEDAGAAIDAVWNDEARAAVHAGVLATAAPHAATSADALTPRLDAYAEQWRAARTDACLDHTVHGTWNADVDDRATWCLDELELELASLVAELRDADVEAVTRAVRAAADLRQVEPCRDAALLLRLPAPPTEARREVEDVRAALSRARSMEATGAYRDGLVVARDALARAEAVAWPPVVAAAHLRLGSLLQHTGEFAEAEATLEKAYFEAVRAGAVEDALAAADNLAITVGVSLARHRDGDRWWNHADTIRATLPDPMRLREAAGEMVLAGLRDDEGDAQGAAELYAHAAEIREEVLGAEHPDALVSLSGLASIHLSMGRLDEAAAVHERVLAMRERTLGPTHPDVGSSVEDVAVVRHMMGRYPEGRELYRRALAMRERALGSEHPSVAITLSNFGELERDTGAYEEASALHQRALRIRERALGPMHPDVAMSLHATANVHTQTGAYEQAVPLYERAIAIMERSLGPEHPRVALSLNGLGMIRESTGAHAEAVELYERAIAIRERAFGPDDDGLAPVINNLAIAREAMGAREEAARLYERALKAFERSLGPEHPSVAAALSNLAVVKTKLGQQAEAKPLYDRALQILERALGPEHQSVSFPLMGLARVALAEKRAADAVALAERAVRVREGGDAPATDLAEARMWLARALVESGASRERAVELARQAREGYRAAGEGYVDAVAEADAWLREHARGE